LKAGWRLTGLFTNVEQWEGKKKRYIIESPRMADRQNCIACTPSRSLSDFQLGKKDIRYFIESPRMDRQTQGVY
jgi:hypothetical protein